VPEVDVAPSSRARLTSTYRLQLHAGFTFADARAVVPYLAELGVSHLYLSPVLQAAPGSMHGYDVVDHSRVSDDLGGRAGLEALAAVAHEHGLGIVVDVVPNHMCIPEPEHLNVQLWDVLLHGQDSAYAHWFDVDWSLCDGKLGLPVLGDSLDKVLAAGELALDEHDGSPVIRYHGHLFPVAPSTLTNDVTTTLAAQHYVLASWRDKDRVLGYRRFFDVDTLIAIRVELDDVFDATHAVLLELYDAGAVDGFRIDHPDGLADPEGYLARLRERTHDAWVVVEKILEGDERLPTTWATAGTTGYDASSVIQTALTPPTGASLDELWRDISGDETLSDVEHAAKRQVVTTLLRPEVDRLVRRFTELSAAHRARGLSDADNSGVREAFETLLSHVEVYRAYLRPGTPADPLAVHRLDAMTAAATVERPDLSAVLTEIRAVLGDIDSDDPVVHDLVLRFQQVCGPAMAKGVEDTTFYRFHRLIALNEVGGDPGALDTPGPDRLHAWAAYQHAHHPRGLTTLSTHDTKRSEDVRARLLALAGDPVAWQRLWSQVSARAAEHVVDGPTAYLLFQTLVGAWPIDEQRLTGYLEKAMREAKRHTSWNDPDPAYEGRVLDLARACLSDAALVAQVKEVLAEHATEITATTLAAKVLQLTLPGVPDVYQGCEWLALTLVDPDNRRPARFASPAVDDPDPVLGLIKQRLTRTVLRLRRDRPGLFGAEAAYRPLDSSSHLLGFVRENGDESVATVVPRVSRTREAAWIELPAGRWTDVLSGVTRDGGPHQRDELLGHLPVAVLVREVA
jgi:(1->4)-alpha-D-glucan 1-alpha-D-glucosylmutase